MSRLLAFCIYKQIDGILTFMSRNKSSLGISEPKNAEFRDMFFYTFGHLKFLAQLSWAWQKFYYLGA